MLPDLCHEFRQAQSFLTYNNNTSTITATTAATTTTTTTTAAAAEATAKKQQQQEQKQQHNHHHLLVEGLACCQAGAKPSPTSPAQLLEGLVSGQHDISNTCCLAPLAEPSSQLDEARLLRPVEAVGFRHHHSAITDALLLESRHLDHKLEVWGRCSEGSFTAPRTSPRTPSAAWSLAGLTQGPVAPAGLSQKYDIYCTMLLLLAGPRRIKPSTPVR